MNIREVTEVFTAMEQYGYSQTSIPIRALLYGVSDGKGFKGRSDLRQLASFVYRGRLLYIRKDVLETKTKPLVLAKGQMAKGRRKAVVQDSRKA